MRGATRFSRFILTGIKVFYDISTNYYYCSTVFIYYRAKVFDS